MCDAGTSLLSRCPHLSTKWASALRKISDSCRAKFPNSTSRSRHQCGAEGRRGSTHIAISAFVEYPFIVVLVLFTGQATARMSGSISFRLNRNSSVQLRLDICAKISLEEADEISFVRNSNLSSCLVALVCRITVCIVLGVVVDVH